MFDSKTLGTNVLELQFVLCWQTMIKTLSLGLGLLKVFLFVTACCDNSGVSGVVT